MLANGFAELVDVAGLEAAQDFVPTAGETTFFAVREMFEQAIKGGSTSDVIGLDAADLVEQTGEVGGGERGGIGYFIDPTIDGIGVAFGEDEEIGRLPVGEGCAVVYECVVAWPGIGAFDDDFVAVIEKHTTGHAWGVGFDDAADEHIGGGGGAEDAGELFGVAGVGEFSVGDLITWGALEVIAFVVDDGEAHAIEFFAMPEVDLADSAHIDASGKAHTELEATETSVERVIDVLLGFENGLDEFLFVTVPSVTKLLEPFDDSPALHPEQEGSEVMIVAHLDFGDVDAASTADLAACGDRDFDLAEVEMLDVSVFANEVGDEAASQGVPERDEVGIGGRRGLGGEERFEHELALLEAAPGQPADGHRRFSKTDARC